MSDAAPRPAPQLGPLTVLETCLYFDDPEPIRSFYEDVLGFRLISEDPGRFYFFRAGPTMLLLFHAGQALAQSSPPPHGATGPGHVCFRASEGDYDAWKARLSDGGIAVVEETSWPNGRSFYFRDPAGNVLEIADRDIWPT
jgi:catechol 2,3-dioxygenase-like lactoylglutathione lyase family enzyme